MVVPPHSYEGGGTFSPAIDLAEYPGGDLVVKGLADLAEGIVSEEALLVLIAGPRLQDLGFEFQNPNGLELPFEHRLYERIEERMEQGAH